MTCDGRVPARSEREGYKVDIAAGRRMQTIEQNGNENSAAGTPNGSSRNNPSRKIQTKNIIYKNKHCEIGLLKNLL